MKTRIVLICATSLFSVICARQSFANPVGGVVAGGSANATITGQGTAATTINQTANNVVINWQDFSIGAGEITRFIQPSANATALNRVVGGNPTEIFGRLQATGNTIVLNANGIMVRAGGQIDTKSFVASTLDVSDRSFMAGGNLIFSGTSAAGIRNEGVIQGLGNGVYLIAHTVENSGTISAPRGTVGLAAGSTVQLVQSGNEHLSVLAGNATAAAAGVNNQGTIQAASAELTAAGGNMYALAINNGGIVRASGITRRNGHIYLSASGGNIQNSGTLSAHNANGSGGTVIVDGGHNAAAPSTVVNSGTIEARGDAAGTKGGTVEFLGDQVGLLDGALVDVSGEAGGGAALIGGDFQGANPAIRNATTTTVEAGAEIRADSRQSGNAGKVVVWSDDTTVFRGTINARALGATGRGGSAEISGKQHLLVTGHADLTGANGESGQLLLDPGSVNIVSGTNSAPPGTLDTFNDGWINAQLGLGVLTISTANANNANPQDLTVQAGAAISWNNANSLTLIGNNSVNLQSGSSIVNAGSGGLSLQSGAGTVTLGGSVNLAGGLTVNASGAGTFAASGSTTVGGALNVTAAGGIAVNSVLRANSVVLNSAATLNAAGTTAAPTVRTTGGGQTYAGAVTLSAATVLEDTANGAIALNSTVNGAQTLEVDTAGATTFGGGVGGTTPLTSLTTDAAAAAAGSKGGSVAVNATVRAGSLALNDSTITLNAAGTTAAPTVRTTGGGQSLAGAVTLSAATVLEDTANGAMAFNSTVDGAQSLQVNTAGATTFSGAVGGTTPLSSLTTDAAAAAAGSKGGTVAVNATLRTGSLALNDPAITLNAAGTTLNPSIRTTVAGGQTYAGAVTLGQDTVLEATASGAAAFNSTVDGAHSLEVDTAGATTFAGAVGGTTPLTGLTTDAAAASAGSKGGSVTVNAVVRSGALALNDATITLNAAGTTGNPTVQTTGGGQTYGGAVTLSAATVLEDTGSGAIALNSTVNGARTLEVNTAGTTTFDGVVGSTAALTSLETDNAAAAAGSKGGTTTVNHNVTTTAGQTYNDSTVTADGIALGGTTITINNRLSPGGDAGVGALGINGNLTFGAGAIYYVTLNGTGANFDQVTINGGSRVLTINATADLQGQAPFAYAVGNNLRVINNGGSLVGQFASAPVTIDGQQFTVGYGGSDVTLTRSISTWTWDGGAGNNNWSSQNNWVGNNGVPGNGDSVIFAGTTRLAPNNNIAGLQLGQISFQAGAGAFTLGGNAVTLTSGVANNSANVQTINMPLTLAADQIFSAASSALVFGGTIQGGFNLTLSGTAVTLGGVVGGGGSPLASLNVTTPLITLSGAGINTSGAQTYGGAVTLGANAILTSGTGVAFNSTVDRDGNGAWNLAADAGSGSTAFGANVGSGANGPLGAIDLTGAVTGNGQLAAGTLTLNGNGDVGSSGTRLSTAVATLVENKTGGDTYINEADAVNLHGSTAGNLILSAGAGSSDVTIDGALSAAGGQIAANNLILAFNGDVGTLGNRLNTAVNALVDNKTGGNVFISEASGLNLSGTFTGGNLDLADAGATTVIAALNAGAGNVTLSGAVNGAGLLTAGTLSLNFLGDVGAAGAGNALNTTVNSLVLNKGTGNTYINETDGVSVEGITSGGLNLTAKGNINQLGGSLTVGGPSVFTIDGVTASVLLDHAGNDFVSQSVTIQAINTGGAVQDVSFRNASALASYSQLNLPAGLQNLTLYFDTAALNLGSLSLAGNLTATGNGLSVGGGIVANNASFTSFGTMSVNNPVNVGAGNIALNNAGALTGSGTLSAGTLTLAGNGNVGSAGARLNTQVAALVDGKSGGSAFVSETDGLDLSGTMTGGNLDLADGGITTLNSGLNAGAGAVTLSGGVTGAGLLTADTLNLAGAGNVGLNTAVNTLVDNKSSGSSLINEADAVNLSGAMSGGDLDVTAGGTITLNAALNAGAGSVTLHGPVAGSGLLTAGLLSLDGGGNVGSSATRLNTAVISLVDSKTGGNAFINEADGLNLSGTMTGGNLDLADSGTTTLNAALNAGPGTVTLAGAVAGAGLLTADTLNLNGSGNVGASGARLNTAVNSLVLGKTAGSTFVNDAGGLNLSGATGGGNLDVAAGGPTTINAALNAGAGSVALGGVVNGSGLLTAGTLSLNGAGDVGAAGAGNALNVSVSTLALNKSAGDTFINEANALVLQGNSAGNLNLTAHGNITQSGVLTFNGAGTTATFAAGSGNDITLNNAANDFTTVTIGSGRNVSLSDVNSINIANSAISGNTVVISGVNPNNDVNFTDTTIGGNLTVIAGGNETEVNTSVAGSKSLSLFGGTQQKSTAARSLVVTVYIPLPRLDSANFSDSSLGGVDPAQLLPPGSIGTLWLQLPFPPKEQKNYRVEDIMKWAGGPVAFAGTTGGSAAGGGH